MYILIRRLAAGSGNDRAFKDEELVADRLSIGRGTDQELLLPGERVAYQHAEISISAGQVRIRSLASTGITVNGRSCRMAVLNQGDQILVGDYRLQMLPTPDGIDIALSLEALEQQDAPLDESRFVTRLDALARWRPRRWAWSLASLVFLLALLLPALVTLKPDWQSFLRDTPLPDDSLWLSGPLHSVHSTIGKDCQACHVKPFERVSNDTCIACHEDTGLHVPVDHPAVLVFDGERCASCHHEHTSQQRMVFEEQRFCADCHGRLDHMMSDHPGIGVATDFSRQHPEFRLSLLQWKPEKQHWIQSRRMTVDESLQEQSHLYFDHQQHLDVDGLMNNDGVTRRLECASCHQLALSGITMAPIQMEAHCGDCHGLAFDPDMPERTVPHGKPNQVLASLREYYSGVFIRNQIDAGVVRAPRPGQQDSIAELQRDGLLWVEQQSMAVAEDLFERRACATCHDVERIEGEPTAWHVMPVKLNQQWFVSSEFPHVRHTQMECADCHAAEQSNHATDILMPDIAVCRDCHVGQQSRAGLQSGCISCHSYHVHSPAAYSPGGELRSGP